MFLKSPHLLKTSPNIHPVRLATTTTLREKWDLLAAVYLERKPIITPPMNELEAEFKQMQARVELERSLKSNFELKHEADLKQLEALKSGANVEEVDLGLRQTSQDLLDAWTDELSKFEPADRTTKTEDDVTSLNRKLDKHLVLVTNQQIGKDRLYLLPQGARRDGETLRQTAERVLQQHCGSEIKTQIYGNAPCGFYKYKYPAKVRDENNSVGAKVFIYFARYLQGNVSQPGDFKWLDKEELAKSFPPKYKSAVSQLMIE